MITNNFNDLLHNANLSIMKAVEILELSKSTIINYKSGKTKPKKSTIKFLKLIAGDLSVLDINYKGWILKRGEIISPENDTFSLDRLNYIQIAFGQYRETRLKNKELIEHLDKLEKENRILKAKNNIKAACNDNIFKKVFITYPK